VCIWIQLTNCPPVFYFALRHWLDAKFTCSQERLEAHIGNSGGYARQTWDWREPTRAVRLIRRWRMLVRVAADAVTDSLLQVPGDG
jgi:hypothetical protein